MRAALASTALAIVLAGLLAACTAGSVDSVTAITIDGGDRTLVAGDVVTLTATVTATGGANTTVAWTSDDETVATIDDSGQLTALAGGTADITATSVFDPTQAAAITLTVSPQPSVASVTIDGGDRTLVVGDVVQLSATVTTTGGASDAVAWASDDEAVATVDANGQVIAHGVGTAHISATSVVDPTQTDAITLTVDAPGAALWIRQFGTTDVDLVAGVASDADGRVYVAGTTAGDLDGANAGSGDVFVRAYDTDGSVRWTRQFGTATDDWGTGIAVHGGDVLFVTGYTAGNLDGTNAGGYDAFVRAYDLDGQLLWGRLFGTNGLEFARAIATDADGNAYVGGQTSGALEAPAAGGADAFVRAYAPDGALLWTRQFGSASDDRASAVAVDPTGIVLVGGDTLGALEGLNAGSFDAFVRAYDASGVLQWTRQFGGPGADWVLGVATDADGNAYAAGATTSDLAGPSAGGFDVFVRAFDADSDVLWTRQFGTGGADSAYAIAADADGHLTIVGSTRGGLDGANAGGADAFVRTYDAAGTAGWTRQFGTSGDDYAYGVALDTHGAYVAGDTTGALDGANLGFQDGFVRQHER